MAKSTDRPLMRQKINVTPTLLKKWEANYHFHNRQVMTPSLMKTEDIGLTFEHQGRTFEIVGMGESDSIILRETREEGVFYWECTRKFVQFKLERFNRIFQKLPNGKTTLVNIPYEEIQLLLAPKGRKRAKKQEDEDTEDIITDEFERIENYVDEIADESETEI